MRGHFDKRNSEAHAFSVRFFYGFASSHSSTATVTYAATAAPIFARSVILIFQFTFIRLASCPFVKKPHRGAQRLWRRRMLPFTQDSVLRLIPERRDCVCVWHRVDVWLCGFFLSFVGSDLLPTQSSVGRLIQRHICCTVNSMRGFSLSCFL